MGRKIDAMTPASDMISVVTASVAAIRQTRQVAASFLYTIRLGSFSRHYKDCNVADSSIRGSAVYRQT